MQAIGENLQRENWELYPICQIKIRSLVKSTDEHDMDVFSISRQKVCTYGNAREHPSFFTHAYPFALPTGSLLRRSVIAFLTDV